MRAKIVPVTELKPKLLQVVSNVQEAGQEYIVTKNGKPAAIIMNYDEWESWKETMDILSDKKARSRIRKNRTFFKRGRRGKTIGEVFGKAA